MSKYSTGRTRAAGIVLAALTVSLVAEGAWGQTSNYIPNDFGNWTDPDSWDNGVPDAVGVNAVLPQPISSTENRGTYNLSLNSEEITLGSLTSNNDPTGARYFRTQISGGSIVFQTTSGPATLSENGVELANTEVTADLETRMRIDVPVLLNSDLIVNSNHALNKNTNTEFVQLVTGAADKTITKEGFGNLQSAATTPLGESEGFFGNLIINNGGVRLITPGNITPGSVNNVQFSKAAGITVNQNGQLQLGNRITAFSIAPGGEVKLNGTGKVAPAATSQNDGSLRFENTANLGITCTFDSPVNLQSASHIQVQAADVTGVLTQEVRGVGELQKTGAGTLALNFANTYAGGTTVLAGALKVDGSSATLGTGNVTVNGPTTSSGALLSIESGVLNAIANSATLSLTGGGTVGVADQNYINLGAGVNEIIGGLVLGGAPMAPGIYGSTGSAAPLANRSDEFFAGTGVVTVSAAFLAADFNNSGQVDATDFNIWKGGFGNAAGQAKINGDANGDAAVNGADFLVWQQQFGSGSGAVPTAAAIPEPSAALLALLAAPLAAMVRRKR